MGAPPGPLIEERVLDLRTAFAGSPDEQRAALRPVLKEERLRVFADPDPQVRCRVNGLLWIPLTEQARDREGLRAGRIGGSGRRHVRDEPVLLDEHAPLPWAA